MTIDKFLLKAHLYNPANYKKANLEAEIPYIVVSSKRGPEEGKSFSLRYDDKWYSCYKKDLPDLLAWSRNAMSPDDTIEVVISEVNRSFTVYKETPRKRVINTSKYLENKHFGVF